MRTLITTARAILERTRLPAAVRNARLELRPGATQRLDALIEHLESVGFERVTLVDDVAQFSVRGGIVDIYSFGMANPVRLELWGDEIASLRHFDLATQRSTRDAASAVILPVDGRRGDDNEASARGTVADLFPPDTLIVVPSRLASRARDASARGTRPRTTSTSRAGAARTCRIATSSFRRPTRRNSSSRASAAFAISIAMSATDGGARSADIVFPIRPPDTVDRDIKRLRRLVSRRDADDHPLRQRRPVRAPRRDPERGRGARHRRRRSPSASSTAASSCRARARPQPGCAFSPTTRSSGASGASGVHRRYGSGSSLESITALKPGDYVVHLEHGVGIYRGIEHVFVGESTIEVAVIEYEGGDRLNVPLYRIDQVERYRSADDVTSDAPPPRLHKLGGKRWAQQRDKTRAAMQEMTRRAARPVRAPPQSPRRSAAFPDTTWQRQLESSFLFEDTPDQRKATDEVKADMEATRPMDRLLVGDVGYGKTEIAVRAAFKAVQSGRQVAVLVPTTDSRRAARAHVHGTPRRLSRVRRDALAAFRPAKEITSTLVEIAEKKVDIVIGTHRLLSADVNFGNLGLSSSTRSTGSA